MRSSESIKNIAGALVKAQMKMESATKSAANPYFKSKYADLPAVLESAKAAFNSEGIVILQPTSFQNGRPVVTTRLLHESGEFLEDDTDIVCSKQNDPQAYGSAITYARRYGLQSFSGMPAEDDDGESAMGRTQSKFAQVAKAKTEAAAPVASINHKLEGEVATSLAAYIDANKGPVETDVDMPKEAPKAKASFRKPAAKAAAPAPAVEDGWT